MSNRDCTKYKKKSLGETFVTGGLWYGTICIPKLLEDLIIMIIFPPLFVFLKQKEKNFNNINLIIKNFLLTCLFYFPGLIHAIFIKNHNK